MSFAEGADEPLRAAADPSLMREMNQRLLLDRLFTGGPVTRPQLAQGTGLSLPTVSAALAGLTGAGLAREAGSPDAAPGRPAVLYEANPVAGAVAGIDVGHEWLHVLITDLKAARLSALDVRNTAASAAGLVDLISRSVARAAAEAGVARVTHTVLGTPGVFDPRAGRVAYAANLPGWQDLDLGAALSARLGPSLTVDNDANLAALGERAEGAARGISQFAYLMIGTGVGMGLILDGRLYRGFTGSAGEVGYLPIGPGDPAQAPRGQWRGMLEESLSARAVVSGARDQGMTGASTAAGVFAAARAGDAAAMAAVRGEAERLALVIASICAFVDPELIVLGGGVGQNLDLLEPPLRDRLAGLIPMRPVLRASELRDQAVVRGAVAVGVGQAREIVFREAVEAGRSRRRPPAGKGTAGAGGPSSGGAG